MALRGPTLPSLIMNAYQNSRPTGRLSADGTQMECQTFKKSLPGAEEEKDGPTFWIPLTPEMKAKILEQNNSVVSVGDVAITPELRERVYTNVLVGGRAFTVPVKEDAPNVCGVINRDEPADVVKSIALPTDSNAASTAEHSGFNVNYYSVEIKHPKRPDRAPYIFEVEDLIQALNLGFHEGTVLKSLVRSANEREHGKTKLGGDAVRDAEKMVHSSGEHLRALKIKAGK